MRVTESVTVCSLIALCLLASIAVLAQNVWALGSFIEDRTHVDSLRGLTSIALPGVGGIGAVVSVR